MHRPSAALLVAILAATGCDVLRDRETAPPIDFERTAAQQVPRPTDGRPEVNATARASRDAKPKWWTGSLPRGLVWDVSDGAVPPSHWPEARALFELAEGTTHAGALRGQMVACRVDVEFSEFKRYALRPGRHSAADLILRGWLGKESDKERATSVSIWGSKESNRSYLAFPLAWLEEGDPIVVRMEDRDRILDRDFIEQVKIPYAGRMPVSHRGTRSVTECRVVPDARLHELALDAAWQIDRTLTTLAGARVEEVSQPLAYDETLMSFYDLARLVGWSDPRVSSRVGALGTIAAAQAQRARESALAAAESLPTKGEVKQPGFSVRVSESTCVDIETEVANCTVTLEVLPGAAIEVRGGRWGEDTVSFSLVWDTGRDTPAAVKSIGGEHQPRWNAAAVTLAAGERTSIVLSSAAVRLAANTPVPVPYERASVVATDVFTSRPGEPARKRVTIAAPQQRSE